VRCILEEALADELFQVLLDASTVDSLLPLFVMVRAVFFCLGEYGIILAWFRMSDPWLVLDGVEDLIDSELQQSEVLCQLVGLEWTWREN